MHEDLEFFRAGTDELAKLTTLVGIANPLMDASQSAKLTILVGLADSPAQQPSRLSRLVIGLADSPVVDPANLPKKLLNRPSEILVILGPIYVIGGLSCWHIYEIQVLKLIRVFGGVLLNMCYITMSSTEESLKICY
jgi:hypothetical protein